jgi:hypothetical protein
MGVHAPEMVEKIRIRAGDKTRTRWSDYEILSALNDARVMLWIALAESFSSIPRRRVELVLSDGRAPLPEDFYSLVEDLPRGVEVQGFHVARTRPARIPEGEDIVTLEYNGLPLPSEDMDYIPGSPLFDVKDIKGGARISYSGYAIPGTQLFELTDTENGVRVNYNGHPFEDDALYMVTTPLALVIDVVEIASFILAGNTEGAVQVAGNTATRVSQKREYARVPNSRPIP